MLRTRRFSLIVAAVVFTSSTGRAQHDGQRNAVQQIARSQPAAAAKELENKQLADAGETRFIEMLSLLDQGRAEEALQKARAAVEAGLPFERLVVGPRDLLSKLHALPEYQRWKNEVMPSPLIHGPMVGSVTDTSASFWVRTAEPAGVSIELRSVDAPDDAPPTATISGKTSATSDYTAVLTAKQLKPNTEYRYAVAVDDETISTEKTEFRTFPRRGEAAEFTVGFGGGAGYVPKWESMWDTISRFDPIAFFMLGDNVYIDDPTHLLTQQYCYYRRQSRPEWRRFTASTAIFSIYDDHDFGTNDCEPGPDVDIPQWERPVLRTFRTNWVNPGYGGGEENPGCWYDFHIGDVHFIMLDGRYYRHRKSKSMLGDFQKRWLLDTLKNSSATFKVIASPVPFTPNIKPGSKDPWDGYPEEREEIFSFIEEQSIDGVFLIAADRHRTDLRTIDRPNGYTLYEFESSRLTNIHTHNVVKTEGLIWGYNEKCSFALMHFDTTAEDPQVTFKAIDIDGKQQAAFTLNRRRLQTR